MSLLERLEDIFIMFQLELCDRETDPFFRLSKISYISFVALFKISSEC